MESLTWSELAPGVGFDLVDVDRFRLAMERNGRRFRERVFTPQEQAECDGRADPILHYAARFAAKEAGMKALGTGWSGGVGFRDFEVHSNGKQAPRLELHGKAAEVAQRLGLRGLRVSLSHTERSAGAAVVALPV